MRIYRASSTASFGFGGDGVINAQYDIVVCCDDVGIVSIKHIGHKTQKEKLFFSRTLSHDEAINMQTEKRIRKQAFTRCDRLESLYRSQLLRLSKLNVSGRENRLRVIELAMNVEDKQRKLTVHRNSI